MFSRPLAAAFDLAVCLLMMFMILALTASDSKTSHIPTYGKMAVTATWAPNANDDIDIYVRDPLGNIVYFANKSFPNMHLERDDLGTQLSGTQTLPNGRKVIVSYNGERIVITSVIPGEYTVNLHYYRLATKGGLDVLVQLWQLQGNDVVLMSKKVHLLREGDEVTVWRFTLDANGNVSRVNTLHADLVYNAKIPSPTIAPTSSPPTLH